MYRFGDKDYKLILLDTNILRETVLNTHETGEGLLEKFFIANDNYAPCFSFLNVIELKPYEDIYKRFLNFFEVMPCVMFHMPQQIFEQEYRVNKGEAETVLSLNIMRPFSPFFKNESLKFKNHLEATWCELEQAVEIMIDDLDSTVSEWRGQRMISQIKMRLKNASAEEKERAKNGLRMLGVECEFENDYSVDMNHYKIKEPEIVARSLRAFGVNCGEDIDTIQFPGARLMAFSQHRKVYLTNTNITKNDTMDVAISCIIPYLDAVITEAPMAETYKQAKKAIPQMKNIEIYTLRDIRKA